MDRVSHRCCGTAAPPDDTDLVEAFAVVREGCPALNEVLIPASLWPAYRSFLREPLDPAHHLPILFGAFRLGRLRAYTLPVHRFLLDGAHRDLVRDDYWNELPERWFLKSDFMARHRASRQYMGKLTELCVAEHLVQKGWTITGLQAWGDVCDILATCPDGQHYCIEVKRIGSLDETLASIVASLNGGAEPYSWSAEAAANYVMTRAYEASSQLALTEGAKVVCIVCDCRAWFTLQVVFGRDTWINWRNPELLECIDPAWQGIRSDTSRRFPAFPGDLAHRLGQLHQVWVLKEVGADYEWFETITLQV